MTSRSVQKTLNVVDSLPAVNHLENVVVEFYKKSDKADVLHRVEVKKNQIKATAVANVKPAKSL
jgi:hypothetical protein